MARGRLVRAQRITCKEAQGTRKAGKGTFGDKGRIQGGAQGTQQHKAGWPECMTPGCSY